MTKNSSEEFSKLVSQKEGEEITTWEESSHIGFTIFKEYESPFVETNEGKNDLYCLIRLGYKNGDSSEKKLLQYDLSVQSRYIQKNHFLLSGSEKDKTFPKKESIELFSKSCIPFGISSSRKSKTYYNTKTKKIHFNKNELNLRQFIDQLYEIHTQSAGLWNNLRYHYSSLLVSYIFEYFTYYFWYKLIHRLIIGGKKINDEEYFKYFLFNGTLVKIDDEDKKLTVDENGLEVQLPLFGGKLSMNKNGLFWGIFILGIFAILFFYNKCGDYWIIKLFEFYKDNEIISGVLIIIWLFIFSFIFSKILPLLTIYIINLTIRLRKGILNKFYYKGLNYDSGNNPYK